MLKAVIGCLAAATAESLPFTFTLCHTAGRAPDPYCPDGFTLTIAAPRPVTNALSLLAPSQYQANWKRSGGSIDGGDVVHFIMHSLMVELGNVQESLSGFQTPDNIVNPSLYMPPIPIDFLSGQAISQGQETLPIFAYPLNLKPLSAYPYSTWQIWRSDWQHSNAGNVLPLVIDGLISSGALEALDNAYGIRLTGETEGGFEWSAVTGYPSEKQIIPLKMQRTIRMSGLTFTTDTTYWFPIGHEVLSREDCQLIADHLLPESVFIDQDETLDSSKFRASADFVGPSYVFPQFHDIELPTHLATPVIYRSVFNITRGKNMYRESSLKLHDRYQIDYHDRLTGEIDLKPPSLAVECSDRTYHVSLHDLEMRPPSPRSETWNLVEGMAIQGWPLPYIASVTLATVVTVAFWFVRIWLPVIFVRSVKQV